MSKLITAKFRCASVTKHSDGSETPVLVAVSGNNEENKNWSKWTPSGRLEMQINNSLAHGILLPGREYEIQITDLTPEPTHVHEDGA